MFRAKFAQTSQDRSATRSQENRAKVSLERSARVFPARCRGKSAPQFQGNNARLCQDRVARVCQGNNVPMCRSRAAAACQGKVARVCQDKCASRCQENSARLLSLFTLVASRSTQPGSKILEHVILLGRRASKQEDDRHIPISAISSFLCPLLKISHTPSAPSLYPLLTFWIYPPRNTDEMKLRAFCYLITVALVIVIIYCLLFVGIEIKRALND